MTSNPLAADRRGRRIARALPLALAFALACLQTGVSVAQDASGLARAKRDAGNPLRLIVEASRLKPRQKAAEAELAAKSATDAAAARQPSGKSAVPNPVPPPTSASVPGRDASGAPAGEPGRSLPVDTARIEPKPAPARSEAPPSPMLAPAPAQVLAESLPLPMQAPPPTTAQAAEPAAAVAPPAAGDPPANAAPTAVAVEVAPTVLELADYVEPTLPERVRRRLRSEGEVVVDFVVGPDGSVADASVRSSSDSALDPIALDAVRQWRYRPIAATQAHAVQLVFRLRD